MLPFATETVCFCSAYQMVGRRNKENQRVQWCYVAIWWRASLMVIAAQTTVCTHLVHCKQVIEDALELIFLDPLVLKYNDTKCEYKI